MSNHTSAPRRARHTAPGCSLRDSVHAIALEVIIDGVSNQGEVRGDVKSEEKRPCIT